MLLAPKPLGSKARAFQAAVPRQQNAAASRRPLAVAARAAAPVATDVLPSSPAALRKALLKIGWEEGWVDVIVGEFKKKRQQAPIAKCEAAIKYLTEEVGVPSASVCNMASINKDFLVRDAASQLRPVVEQIKQRGVTGRALVSLLERHPGLLTYDPSPDGKCLEKGRARASVDVVSGEGGKAAGVSYWREGAAFETAPVAPLKPTV